MKRFLTAYLALWIFQSLCAQSDSSNTDMAFYADVMINASSPKHRLRAAEAFYPKFKEHLSATASLKNGFPEFPGVTTIYPQDSTFRVITWLIDSGDGSKYYGFIQQISGAEQTVIELKDNRSLNTQYSAFNQDTWYGALYYGIQPFAIKEDQHAYILLGFDADTRELNKRVADVLILDGATATFGLPVFIDSTDTKHRVIEEYSDVASATMRFDREKEMIIYDHVITITTPEGPANVPDGSYHGYSYKKGMWHFIDTVFNVTVEEPPGGREKEKVPKDLFGREKN